MIRRIASCCALLGLAACSTVASFQSSVPRGAETFEPRLLGEWTIVAGGEPGRLVVTREGAAQYLLRMTDPRGQSTVLSGRFGALGPRRWVLDLAPVGDTTRYVHPLAGGKDSSRTNPPELALMIPLHMPIVVERADTGLRFYGVNADSLAAYLRGHPSAAPFAVHTEELGGTVILTEDDAAHVNAFLASFADRPGALVPLSRTAKRVTVPSPH